MSAHKKFAGAGGHKVLFKCAHKCNVHSAKFLGVQVCLPGAKILSNSPPYFRTLASPVCMQKVVVLYLDSDIQHITNDQLFQPWDFSHLNMAYTISNIIRKYCNRLVTQKCLKKDHVFFWKSFSFSFKVLFTVQWNSFLTKWSNTSFKDFTLLCLIATYTIPL